MREFFKIVLLFTLAACVYGVLHDQVTARVCLEYFTVGHPRLIDSESPTVLALFWGVVASWWGGLLVGIGAACAARLGTRPALSVRELFPSVRVLLAVMAITSLAAGLAGHALASRGMVWLLEPIASRVAVEDHPRFLADLWVPGPRLFACRDELVPSTRRVPAPSSPARAAPPIRLRSNRVGLTPRRTEPGSSAASSSADGSSTCGGGGPEPSARVITGRRGGNGGRYWTRTSDPQLVEL